MASKHWIGGVSTAVAQVDTFVPATPEIDDIFTLTATGEGGTTAAVSFTCTVATVANVAAGLMAAWNASTNALHTGITASGGVNNVVLTADTAGVPFYVASSTTDGGGNDTQTLARTATTANAGTLDWGTAANWSDGAVPVSTDNVVIDKRGSSYAITYGLNQSAVTLTSLRIVTGHPAIGTSGYALKISATDAEINESAEDGSTDTPAFVNLNTGSNAADITVHTSANTPTSTASSLAPVMLAGSNASNKLAVLGGVVWVGKLSVGESCEFATVDVSAGRLTTGTGVDWTTLTVNGGTVVVEQCATDGTIEINGGTVRTAGTNKVNIVHANGGTLYPNQRSSGDDEIETLNLDGGTVDWRENTSGFTVATLNLKDGGGTLHHFADDQATYTAVTLDDAGARQITVQMS